MKYLIVVDLINVYSSTTECLKLNNDYKLLLLNFSSMLFILINLNFVELYILIEYIFFLNV